MASQPCYNQTQFMKNFLARLHNFPLWQKLAHFFDLFHFDKNHQHLHFRLTLIFSLAMLIIICIYSGLLTASHLAGKRKFQENINLHLPPPPTAPAPDNDNSNTQTIINDGFRAYEKRTQNDILYFDLLIWSIASLSGYFLTGYLLLPAQKKAREQMEFIGNASHELKTPITTIKTELTLMEKNKLSHQLQENLQTIHTEANTLQNLVNNLLAFNSAQDSLHLTPFDLRQLLQEKVNQYQKIYAHKKLTFSIDCPVKSIVHSDHQKIAQIVSLLLDNAGKYATKDTAIKVKVSQNNRHQQIQIINQGLGISAAEEKKIFDRFYRITDARVQKETGSGLGLAIARQLAQELGGQLTLSDGSPAHTTFSLTF